MEPKLIRNKKLFNNQSKLMAILGVLFISLFIGTSYSILTSTDESEEVITFTAGELNLEVKTNTDTTLNLQDELPKSEEEVENPIILNLKNSGNLTICEYRLKLVSDTTQTSDLPTNYIRYAVSENNGTSYSSSKLLSETENQIYIGFDLKPNATKTIYIKIWLDESALEDETVLDKAFYGKIDAELLQKCETEQTVTGVEVLKETLGQTGGIIGIKSDNTKTTSPDDEVREYRYSGVDAKNYVTFNDEKWRIIGIFKDEDGNEHMKIIRNNFLTTEMPATYQAAGKTFQINSNNYGRWDYDGSNYDNNWANAGLMYWLNSKGTDSSDTGYLNKIKSPYKDMIEETKWYLGNVVYTGTAVEDYKNERLTTKTCSSSCSGGDVWSGNEGTWTGKIGLMYPSDMGFSTDSSYWNTNMYNFSSTQVNTTWLKEGHTTYEWFLSPSSYSSYRVANWDSVGYVNYGRADNYSGARPVLYLKSDTTINGGEGTSTTPYTLTS